MKQVKYILVNETGSANAAGVGHCSRVSDFRHHTIVNSKGRSHQALINQLVSLRRQYPDAKILGLGEIDGENIRPSKAMNRLRRELSDLE
ncbi:MAG: hypothetical protein IKY01_01530 [Prevotella sp.]|nr:hypothetical protein [Prevotella sp.]